MRIALDRKNEVLEVGKITILIDSKDFVISIDKFGELVINKCSYGKESSSITIHPKVSNEIGLV